MGENLTIWTLDWVPPGPRGFVRDMRLRWAAEEAALRYEVDTVAFEDRQINHLDRQPFGQVPFLTDGAITIFESGACLTFAPVATAPRPRLRSSALLPGPLSKKHRPINWRISRQPMQAGQDRIDRSNFDFSLLIRVTCYISPAVRTQSPIIEPGAQLSSTFHVDCRHAGVALDGSEGDRRC